MKTILMKAISCAANISLLDSFLGSLAQKLDHAATALREIENKLEEL